MRTLSTVQREREELLVKRHLLPPKYPALAQPSWKPAKLVSYESIQLVRNGHHSVPMGYVLNQPHNTAALKDDTLLGHLLQYWSKRGQGPKLAVCITMYNEDESELKETLAGVMENHERMRADGPLNFGKHDLVVFVIADGYEKLPGSLKRMLTEKKLFDVEQLKEAGFMRRKKDRKRSYASTTTRTSPQFFGDSWEMRHVADLAPDGQVPSNVVHLFMARTWDFEIGPGAPHRWRINFIFAVKQRNDGKIHSHRCFFEGLCQLVNPRYTLLLDVGTRAKPSSIHKLVRHMEGNPNCGGCCGEIEAEVHPAESEGFCSGYMLRAAQYFEYKISHSPDKACESFFGFSSVLPGAYSLFRWNAIQGSPLSQFYKGLQKDSLSCAEANKFLAQDRVMCLQVLIKRKSRYYLRYVPNAVAVTDVPNNLATLFKQRRRWLNGSLFGTLYVLTNAHRLVSCCRAPHPCYIKLGFFLFLLYYLLAFLFFMLALGWLFSMLAVFLSSQLDPLLADSSISLFREMARNHLLSEIFTYIFFFIIVLAMLASLTQPVDRAIGFFRFLVFFLGLFVNAVFFSALYYFCYHGFYMPPEYEQINLLAIAAVIIIGNYAVPFMLRPLDFLFNIHKFLIGLISYLYMLPTFSVLFQIYAFCNLHDISWGNRPASTSAQGLNSLTYDKMKQAVIALDYQVFRSQFLYTWFVINVLFGLMVARFLLPSTMEVSDTSDTAYQFLLISAILMAALVSFKTLTGLLFTCFSNCSQLGDCCCPPGRVQSPSSRLSFERDEWSTKYEHYLTFRDQLLMRLGRPAQVEHVTPSHDTPYYRWN